MKNLKKILLILIVLIAVISFDVKPVKAESKSKNIITNNVYMLKKKKKSSSNGVYNPDYTIKNFMDSKSKNEYKVNCKDFYYLQVAYRAMFYIGPFIYMIFASFDFFKIVMAGNEEQIKKAKKNIPIRLALFLLFLILPTLVRLFASNLGNTDTSAFKCVVGNTIEKP